MKRLVAFLLLLAGCVGPTAPTGGVLPPEAVRVGKGEVYVHQGSRFAFPERVKGFERGEVVRYDGEGANVGVGYNDVKNGIALTAYVYPADAAETVKSHFDACKAQVLQSHQTARTVAESAIQLSPGGVEHKGYWAMFDYEQEFARRKQPVGSELYVFKSEDWFLKLRSTFPAGQRQIAERLVEDFINGLGRPDGVGK
jgi:hypothetical protein